MKPSPSRFFLLPETSDRWLSQQVALHGGGLPMGGEEVGKEEQG